MRRRDFVKVISGSAVTWPLAARAQEVGLKRIGVLQPQPESDADFQGWRAIFSSRLRELGWNDGRNLNIDYRFGTGETTSIAPLAKEMVAQRPDALFAITALSALALRQYTLTIPTVFVLVGDPVALGLVTNLARPNGNVTGFSSSDYKIGGKWIETIRDAMPKLSWAAVFFEAGNPSSPQYMVEIEAAAARGNLRLIPVPIGTSDDIKTGFANLPKDPDGALVAVPVGIIIRQRKGIIALAAEHRLPAIYPYSYFCKEGGLISYGSDIGEQYRSAASYVDRILHGARPADLPVQEPTKFQLVINLKTAKALGFAVPSAMLTRADEVIE